MSFYAGDELSGLFFSEKAKIKFFPIDCISPEFFIKVFPSDFSIILSYVLKKRFLSFNYHFIFPFSLQELNLADWLEEL